MGEEQDFKRGDVKKGGIKYKGRNGPRCLLWDVRTLPI